MLNHLGSPDLHTRRLRLRRYRSEDFLMMFNNWAGDPEVAKYVSWGPHASPEVTKGLVEMWVEGYESPTVYRWGIEKEGELIGDISVVRWREEEESCEIGYCLCRRFWNQGIMTEALDRVIAYLIDTVGFHRVMLCHDTRNPASGRVMQKCGLRMEGVFRGERKRRDGSWMDVAYYAILAEDRA
ncbi:MAG: GNAT family N-acetyltransferase [Clostridia bacterium]|nr:GNAT family N-acetyltransferase [Clostridia bacterium]